MNTDRSTHKTAVSTTSQSGTIALHAQEGLPNDLNLHGDNIKPFSAATKFKKNSKVKVKECKALHETAEKTALSIGLALTEPSKSSPLINTHHRDSCFFQDNLSQLHVFPWKAGASKEPDDSLVPLQPVKFKEFVLANCLFGANLRGIDDNGRKYPLIDHDLKVQDVITDIELGDGLHPYETMVFACFEKLAPLMKSISDENFTVRYHLPVIDYMLYGLHSYISGIMSLSAFEKYVETVAERGNQHKKILKNIAIKNGLTLTIESPFDGLCDASRTLDSNKLLSIIGLSEPQLNDFKAHIRNLENGDAKLAKLEKTCRRTNFDPHKFADLIRILAVVDGYFDTETIPDNSFYEPHTQDIRLLLETICIDNILDRLKTSASCLGYSAIWNNISAKKLVTSFSPLEQLFKVANTTVIACAQEHNSPGAVCSLLPIDEKPIPTSYSNLLAEHYGDVFCLSWLPPVFNYLNSPADISTGKPNLLNNLFRFRSDIFELNQDIFQKKLTSALDLQTSFWRVLLPQTAEPISNRTLSHGGASAFYQLPASPHELKATKADVFIPVNDKIVTGTSPSSPAELLKLIPAHFNH
jgi:hypothetical protein